MCEGKPVVSFKAGIFDDAKDLEELVLSDGMKFIPDSGVSLHPVLKSVTMANSISWIGEYAFQQCPNLETVNISENVDTLRLGFFITVRNSQEWLSLRVLPLLVTLLFMGARV